MIAITKRRLLRLDNSASRCGNVDYGIRIHADLGLELIFEDAFEDS